MEELRSDLIPLSFIYPEKTKERSPYFTYDQLIDSLGYDIVVQVEDDDYQGDTRVLLKASEDWYGWFVFGWGSCSGCDALQACSSLAEVEELRDSMYRSIEWYSRVGMIERFSTKDWSLEFYGSDTKTAEFVAEVLEHLGKQR